MKILITGGNGLLGSNLIKYFTAASGWEVAASSMSRTNASPLVDLVYGDLADPVFVRELIDLTAPDIVINTVALVDVEKCENEPALAHRVNVETAKNLAEAVADSGGRLIHISTDHFFDGAKPFYTEEDMPAPVNNYGLTKLEAERVVLETQENSAVIRTNFYGWCQGVHRPNFGEWMYCSLRDETPVKLFTNYYFTTIEVNHLIEAVEVVAKSDFTGVINIGGSERCSKYDFGIVMADVFGFSLSNVTPVVLDPASFSVPRQPDLSLSVEKFKTIFQRDLPSLKAGLMVFKDTMPERIA